MRINRVETPILDDLTGLRRRFRDDLFDSLLPFWNDHGIDHEHGGVMHGLDYDGTLVHSNKLSWFQGRAIWIYSFLYNRFGRDPRHLEIARRAKEFLLRHAPQPDGWWAEEFTRTGEVVRPFSGDLYGMYFAAEGLQEYAWATGDEPSRELAVSLMEQLWRRVRQPDFERSQAVWMVNLNTARQIHSRWPSTGMAAIVGESIDQVMRRHYNAGIGLNSEVPAEPAKCCLGHSVETLWMIAEEAAARKDEALWAVCTERVRKHLDVGWDPVFGGFSEWVNVDSGAYRWPDFTPVGTDLVFRITGEYFYEKPLWALNEILIATLNIVERTGADWAARYFAMALRVIDEKYAVRKPGYMLFADRRMTFVPHTARQDNYHPLRQLMLNILTLDRMIESAGQGQGTRLPTPPRL